MPKQLNKYLIMCRKPQILAWLECSLEGANAIHCNNHQTVHETCKFHHCTVTIRVNRFSRVNFGLGLALGLGLV